MTKKILVPLDGSALAEQALDIAEKMLDPEVELLLLRVVGPLIVSSKQVDEARDYLEDMVSQLQASHRNVLLDPIVAEGIAPEKIIEAAEEHDAGLIIMTTHGAGGLGRWLMGSVAEKVVRHAPCPVLTIGKRSLQKRSGNG